MKLNSDWIDWPRCNCLTHSPRRDLLRNVMISNAVTIAANAGVVSQISGHCAAGMDQFHALILVALVNVQINADPNDIRNRDITKQSDAIDYRYTITERLDHICETAKKIVADAGEAWTKELAK